MLRLVTVASVAALAVAGASPAAELTFGQPRTVARATAVGGLTEQEVGDLNADGIDDVVVTRIAFPLAPVNFPIGIFLGDGRGGFTDGGSLFAGPVPRTQHGRQIVLADFNGDRRNDIFVADHGYDAPPFPGHPNTLVLSTPDGRLVDSSGNLPPERGFTHSAAAADVDRDGDVDLYQGNVFGGDGSAPGILLNDGRGRFTRADDLIALPYADIAQRRYLRALFMDANADGWPDLVLGADNNTPSSVVLLNDGGRFRTARPLPPKPLGPTSIAISLATTDLDGDGRADLLVGFQREDFSGRRIQVLLGNGDGTFRDETAARLPDQDEGPSWPYALRVGDVNNDGRIDFAVSLSIGPGGETPPLYLEGADGKFAMRRLTGAGPVFSFLDANGDKRLDVLSSYSGEEERHSLQLQLAVPAAPAGLRAASVAGGIRLSWRAASGADRYEVLRASGRAKAGKVLARTRATRYTDTRAARGKLYRYWVRALNAAGPGPLAGPASARRR